MTGDATLGIPFELDENGEKVVADAKYMPLHLYDHLDAERATGVYYKTIMYMYRFNTKKGFLFYPCINDEDNENNIYSEYQIENRKDCHLYEVGLEIDKEAKNYQEFRQNMSGENGKEAVFRKQVNKFIDKRYNQQ